MPREKSERQGWPQTQFRFRPELKKSFKLRCIELDRQMDDVVEELISLWLEGKPVEGSEGKSPDEDVTSRLEAVAKKLEYLEELCRERHGNIEALATGKVHQWTELHPDRIDPKAPRRADEEDAQASPPAQKPRRKK